MKYMPREKIAVCDIAHEIGSMIRQGFGVIDIADATVWLKFW